jgi:hypothetical protein
VLFVSAIIPIEYHRKRVVICDTKSDHVGEMIYGDSVTDEVIRWRAPLVYDKRKRRKRNV